MKLFARDKDGGPESHVWGYWLIEWKRVFSIAILRFEDGTREAFHSHAFNCISWILRGHLIEQHLTGHIDIHKAGLWPIITKRDTFHKVSSRGRTWVLTFRGPWAKNWQEYLPEEDKKIVLAFGRKVVNTTKDTPLCASLQFQTQSPASH